MRDTIGTPTREPSLSELVAVELSDVCISTSEEGVLINCGAAVKAKIGGFELSDIDSCSGDTVIGAVVE